jgi:hypothetical protein
MIWNMIKNEVGMEGTRVILLNTRQDRLDRARQLAELAGRKLVNDADYLMLIGQSSEVVSGMASGYGFPHGKIISLGYVSPEKVFEKMLSITQEKTTIVAIGNMGGMGADTVEYFENRSL